MSNTKNKLFKILDMLEDVKCLKKRKQARVGGDRHERVRAEVVLRDGQKGPCEQRFERHSPEKAPSCSEVDRKTEFHRVQGRLWLLFWRAGEPSLALSQSNRPFCVTG